MPGDLDDTRFFVLLDSDFNHVARAFADLFANRLQQTKHVLWMAVLDEGAGIRETVEGGFDGNAAFGGEFLFGVVGKEDVCSATVAGLDLCLEFVFLHSAGV
jgi:hypothetical protein